MQGLELARETRGKERGRRFRMEEKGASGGRGGGGAKKKRIGSHGHGGELRSELCFGSGVERMMFDFGGLVLYLDTG